MAKQKETDKRTVEMKMDRASNDVNMAVYSLQTLLHGMTVADIISAVETIKAECGDSSVVEITSDDYWGTSSDLTWWREETDEEVEKRIKANEKKRVTTAANRKIVKEKKVKDEKAELKRLQAKYPSEF